MAVKSVVKGSKVTPVNATSVPVTTALVPLPPEFLQKDENDREYLPIRWTAKPEGMENLTDTKIRLGKMKLLNSNSDEVAKKDCRIDGAAAGMFYNSSSGELADTIEIVPLYVYTERYFSFPKSSRNMVCMSIDGSGRFGVCPSGQYDMHQIPTEMVLYEKTKQLLGTCSMCPKSSREWGKGSECQMVVHLVCVTRDFLESMDSVVDGLRAENPDTVSDILNSLFTLSFKSTQLKKLRVITDQANRDMCAYRWYWRMGSITEVNTEQQEWQGYTVLRTDKLTDNQVIFARSLNHFAQAVRPIITDVEAAGSEPEVVTPDTLR